MTNANHPATVSVIGTGNMGSALAEALLAARFRVTVWNRTPARAKPLVEKGYMPLLPPALACVFHYLMGLRKLRNLKVAATKSLNLVFNKI